VTTQLLRKPKPIPVVYASQTAVEQAARYGLKRPLENLVTEAIRYGRVRDSKRDGTATFYIGNLVATAMRTESSLTGRKAYVVVSVRRRETEWAD
jgi:hypothetical protein